MIKRKTRITYYVSTEGLDEVLYLKHLQGLVNKCSTATKQIIFEAKQDKPTSFVKRISTGFENSPFYHICDFEGVEYIENFKHNIDLCKEAISYKGLQDYEFYYTNICFELWIILHKVKFTSSISNKKRYLDVINKAYKLKIKSFSQLKEQVNFSKILSQIELKDVIEAISTAKQICQANLASHKYDSYNKIAFCQHNPDLNLHVLIEKVLKDVGIIKN